MPERIAIGPEDFLELRQAGAAYVDRTAAIGELLRSGHKISVICRPRRFGEQLNQLLSAASTHDFPFPDQEQGYHVFLLGLLAWLRPEYRVLSNLEAGAGRADILVLPATPGGAGVVMELKRARSARQAASLVKTALQQATARRYDERLREAGAGRVVLWGVAFWGKERRVAVQVEPG